MPTNDLTPSSPPATFAGIAEVSITLRQSNNSLGTSGEPWTFAVMQNLTSPLTTITGITATNDQSYPVNLPAGTAGAIVIPPTGNTVAWQVYDDGWPNNGTFMYPHPLGIAVLTWAPGNNPTRLFINYAPYENLSTNINGFTIIYW